MSKKLSIKCALFLALATFGTPRLEAGVATAATTTPPPTEESNPFSLGVAINSDSFFGFYPTFAGSYTVSDTWAFTTYGIFWNGGRLGGSWGEWTEFGVGVAYNPTPWLSINPQIGFLGGNLLSSGAVSPEGVLGDGYVPNLTVNLNSDKWEGQLYTGFYLPLRDEAPAGATQLEFLHYWANVGYKVNQLVSVGVHHESLLGGADLTASTIYSWVGPYIQFRNQDTGIFVRFSGGWEVEGTSDTFWKMAVGFNF